MGKARRPIKAETKPKSKAYTAAFNAGVEETAKAYGGCTKCYGKGYATTLIFAEGAEDFGGDGMPRRQLPPIRPCSCDRGKQLDRLLLEVQHGNIKVIV